MVPALRQPQARLETYTIPGERGSGVIGINGAAAHLVSVGDLVILMAYAQMDDQEARTYEPHVVHVDAGNRIVHLGQDPAEAVVGDVKTPDHAVSSPDARAEVGGRG